MATATRKRPHPFIVDRSLADLSEAARRSRRGLAPRQWCRRCGLPGQPGDERHPFTREEDIQAWREWDAARLGEREH